MKTKNDTFSRQSKRNRQRVWRQKLIRGDASHLGASITVHLTAEEVAVLDHIAMMDYQSRPSLRNGVRDDTPPSRSRAIRQLIAQYRNAFGPSPERILEISKMRKSLGSFWVAERSWRNTGHDRRREISENGEWAVSRPNPPWEPVSGQSDEG